MSRVHQVEKEGKDIPRHRTDNHGFGGKARKSETDSEEVI